MNTVTEKELVLRELADEIHKNLMAAHVIIDELCGSLPPEPAVEAKMPEGALNNLEVELRVLREISRKLDERLGLIKAMI